MEEGIVYDRQAIYEIDSLQKKKKKIAISIRLN